MAGAESAHVGLVGAGLPLYDDASSCPSMSSRSDRLSFPPVIDYARQLDASVAEAQSETDEEAGGVALANHEPFQVDKVGGVPVSDERGGVALLPGLALRAAASVQRHVFNDEESSSARHSSLVHGVRTDGALSFRDGFLVRDARGFVYHDDDDDDRSNDDDDATIVDSRMATPPSNLSHAQLSTPTADLSAMQVPTEPLYHFQPPEDAALSYDSRITHDVSDFLERWHLQFNMPSAGLIALSASRVRDWRPPCAITQRSNDPSAPRDPQGLDWSRFGTTRARARTARRILYQDSGAGSALYRAALPPPPPPMQGRGCEFYRLERSYHEHVARFGHYQLKHMIAATSRSDVFYAHGNKVLRTSLACPEIRDTVIDLSTTSAIRRRASVSCNITTIAVSPGGEFPTYSADSVLLAGGHEGEYALLNLHASSAELPIEGLVTTAADGIITHIHVVPQRRSGAATAVFCSNDKALRLLDVATDTWTSAFAYPDPLNCAATSPDGRLRVVVGDSCQTLITDAERGRVLLTLEQHTDHAFACAWASSGWNVATGAQDGKVVVYDARNWARPLVQLCCEMSCARSLVFTGRPDGVPALVVAESDDVVSIYDTRNWRACQTVEFFGCVTGVAALDGGRELVVANGDKMVGGLMLFAETNDTLAEPLHGDALVSTPDLTSRWTPFEPRSKTKKKKRTGVSSSEVTRGQQAKKLGMCTEQVFI